MFTMEHVHSKAPQRLILIGGCLFILVLFVSVVWEADIRWLHFFQAWMYVAAMVLAVRRSKWGYFIGLSAAGLWDYTNLFATSFFFNGLQVLAHWIQTGQLKRPDLLIAVFAWFSNLMVVAGSIWGYSRPANKGLRDVGWFVLTFALTTGFFALDMAVCQPRYLPLFHEMLHPRLRW